MTNVTGRTQVISGFEIWRDVPGYEGLYKVSNLGNVLGLPKYNARNRFRKYSVVLSKSTHKRTGYTTVCLCKNGDQRTVRLHRIVLSSFTKQPRRKNNVNHINGIKLDCRLENLEWLTSLQNMRHARKIGLFKKRHDVSNQSRGDHGRFV